MQVVIPMSGFGERFRVAGYAVPKPLIKVDGKEIISHVIDMFPGVTDFIFICNEDHLNNPSYQMREIITKYAPKGRIISIGPHKLGPVNAVLLAEQFIDKKRPTVINYCDFSCYWDFKDFKDFVQSTDCDGAIPAYTGFHPHMLTSTNYAYVRETDLWVTDIQEKKPFTQDPRSEFASTGTYYFRNGALAIQYCKECVNLNLSLGDEFYVSLVYKPMLLLGLKIAVYEVQHFMQWGTPKDLEEYQHWSNMFDMVIEQDFNPLNLAGYNVVPMAGQGSRFAKVGYSTPKPLIEVNGYPMVVRATKDLPHTHTILITRDDLSDSRQTFDEVLRGIDNCTVVSLEKLSQGQAETCGRALADLEDDCPITIGACDNGIIYNQILFSNLFNDPNIDLIVWGVRKHPNADLRPEMYGWIDQSEGEISQTSIKKPITDNPVDPHVMIGAFSFKKAKDFQRCLEKLISEDIRVNGEYYVDSCVDIAMKLGLNCRIFTVDSYISWGTPDELKTYEYWQSCFHKWQSHKYDMSLDPRISSTNLKILLSTCKPMMPNRPLSHIPND